MERGMAIDRHLQDGVFDPEAVTALTAAYEEALRRFGLVDRTDPVTELIAARIIACASMGELDPLRLCERALKGISQMSSSEPDGSRLQAQEYRQCAAQCVALAQRMSLHDNKARLLQMAQQWLDVAEDVERRGKGIGAAKGIQQ